MSTQYLLPSPTLWQHPFTLHDSSLEPLSPAFYSKMNVWGHNGTESRSLTQVKRRERRSTSKNHDPLMLLGSSLCRASQSSKSTSSPISRAIHSSKTNGLHVFHDIGKDSVRLPEKTLDEESILLDTVLEPFETLDISETTSPCDGEEAEYDLPPRLSHSPEHDSSQGTNVEQSPMRTQISSLITLNINQGDRS